MYLKSIYRFPICNFKLQIIVIGAKIMERNRNHQTRNSQSAKGGFVMLNNYQYFLMLAKELNISNASEKLFISHQCLSKYLKNLEKFYGIALFERKPSLRLTPAGEVLLKSFKDIEFLEQNIKSEIENLKSTEVGTVNLGITEGRYPIVVPRLLKDYQQMCPHVHLNIINTTTPRMRDMTLNNELDLLKIFACLIYIANGGWKTL